MNAQIFHDSDADRNHRSRMPLGRIGIYAILIIWAFICLFPIYWTATTSFKIAPNVMQGAMIPWVDYQPDWKGWRAIGLSPDTIGTDSTVRNEFLKRFGNSAIVALASSVLAVALGSLAAYGLSRFSYKWAWMRNND
ncbi:MAG: carbohydrate ABC transporter permease, partial [Paracoccaceae bacterium]